jgi:hypothetical protein
MLQDKIFDIKSELRQMAKGDLLKMTFCQKERSCLLGGPCPFLLDHQEILFCVSEVLGQGCQMEKLRALLSSDEAQGREQSRDQSLDLSVGPYLPGLGQRTSTTRPRTRKNHLEHAGEDR